VSDMIVYVTLATNCNNSNISKHNKEGGLPLKIRWHIQQSQSENSRIVYTTF